MKLQFKHQKFQADAAKAVCDVFAGQPYLIPTYMMDKGIESEKDKGIWMKLSLQAGAIID